MIPPSPIARLFNFSPGVDFVYILWSLVIWFFDHFPSSAETCVKLDGYY